MMASRRVWLLSCAVILCSHHIAQALISEGQPSSIYTNCLQRAAESLQSYPSTNRSDESLQWSCIQSYLWETAAERIAPRNLTINETDFLTILVGNPLEVLNKQTVGPRVDLLSVLRTKRNDHSILKRSVANVPRKEYRALTDAERNAVHAALNLAKNSDMLSPNVYDFVASLHSGVLARGAHWGPAFLGFHRIYILIMDLVISYFDSTDTVRLPYWDNTLDNELANPTESIMWHSSFAGQGNGFVNDGPFGTWATLEGPSIRRSVGSGSLMSQSDIDNVMTRNYLTQISKPTAAPQYDLEGHHGIVHGWVGGDMEALSTATNDPVFFMHHAFIDCIWERFRDRQQSIGTNPSIDYPNTQQNFHRPSDSIGIVSSITNLQAVSSFYASLATCEWPVCPNCGNSPYLRCINNRCVPVLSGGTDPSPSCTGDNQYGYNGYQNSYCINGYCDISEWAYVPVQITYNRPPDYDARGSYGSYPVVNGQAQQIYDIYSPQGYSGPVRRSYEAQSQLPRYTDCGCRGGGASSGQVYLQSYGVNYDGFYREYAVVDRRYAISSSVGYVAVRNPRSSAAQAYISVYDDCGRICRPTCWDCRTRRWVACSGAVTITSEGGSYRGYGGSYAEASYQVYGYGGTESYEYATYSSNNVYLNYVCDFSGTFPWYDYTTTPPPYVPPTTTDTTQMTYPTQTTYPPIMTDTPPPYVNPITTTPPPYVNPITTDTPPPYVNPITTTPPPYVNPITTTPPPYVNPITTTTPPPYVPPTTRTTYPPTTTRRYYY